MSRKINPVPVKIPVTIPPSLRIEEISIVIEGPQAVSGELQGGAQSTVSFTTETVGTYKINLRHNGSHLPSSPISVEVKPKTNENDKPVIPALPPNTQVATKGAGHVVSFEVPALYSNGSAIPPTEDLSIQLSGAEKVAPSVSRNGDNIAISFETNVVEGLFIVGVLNKGNHIANSPFEIKIASQ